MSSVTVSEARAALREVLERVQAGEEVTITRHGQPVAVVVRPDLLRIRKAAGALASAAKVADLLSAGRCSPLPTVSGPSDERAEELVAAVCNARASATDATFSWRGSRELLRRSARGPLIWAAGSGDCGRRTDPRPDWRAIGSNIWHHVWHEAHNLVPPGRIEGRAGAHRGRAGHERSRSRPGCADRGDCRRPTPCATAAVVRQRGPDVGRACRRRTSRRLRQ